MLTTQKDLIKQLNKLRVIAPSADSAARGRALIFIEGEPRRFPPVLAWASVFALIILVFSVSYQTLISPATNIISASLNSDQLNQEFNNLSINIELKDISYRQNVNQAIASAISEIESNEARHLNPDVLKSEEQNLNINSTTDPQIDQLLKTIIL
ncbi:MAG: hypothetical protein UY23_C0001G0127 [Candidatus Jorgensenbacteria bacterium GW2011_GWA1_48_11]|uniref:Uncharacterized protein n=1 Tax=Candidatus Jorgensenbacteria bacterium GW2011_GWA1_48_11 TaxID=1618660 RepID=A0A0G1UBI2_9BACT|nr:MAG: hypothetical protein UY23_C0001G0127 [Candidatus Jorgensenbacteria bacterium GW2011_GWA1_48_11]KKW12014.1 MAG: hypothetical protein UY51_C0005G0256 [Candidatus Jorgensenbacteria bacterium GW2011_GWB1_49_9]